MSSLLDTLMGLRKDPTLVLQLYKQLFESEFYAIVELGTDNSIDEMSFLTYETLDKISELPLFTDEKFIPVSLSKGSIISQVEGIELWQRLLNIVENGKCEIAINPLQEHGIRLKREMILGMISKYGEQ